MPRTPSSRLPFGKPSVSYRSLSRCRRAVSGSAGIAAIVVLLPTLAAIPPAEADDQSAGAASTMATTPVPELSTATSDTVREADGSFTMTAYTEPVNYLDASGEWAPIDNTLVDAPGDAYDVENGANSFTAKIPGDPSTTPIKLVDAEAWITMRMHGIADQPAAVVDDTATFDQVAKADGVEYKVTNTGLKEAIILDAAPAAPLSYSYTVDASRGLTPALEDNGSIVFSAPDGSASFTIPAGIMYDEGGATSGAVSYSLDPAGDGWSLSVTPNMAWLTDPARDYPVVVDPSITTRPTTDCWIQSANPTGTACGNSSTYIRVGRKDSTTRYRGLLDFDVSTVPSDAKVSYASLTLNLDSSQSYSSATADYSVFSAAKAFAAGATWNSSNLNGSWDGGWISGSQPLATKTMAGDTSGDKTFFGLAPLVQGWIDGSATHNGFVVKQDPETTNNVLYFYSSSTSSSNDNKRPTLSVTYGFPPRTPETLSASPSGPGYVASDTPTFTAVTKDAAKVRFDVKDGTSSVVWSGTSTDTAANDAASVTVPSGVLTLGTSYSLTATAINDFGRSAGTTAMQFVVAEPSPSTDGALQLTDIEVDDDDALDFGSDTPWDSAWGPAPVDIGGTEPLKDYATAEWDPAWGSQPARQADYVCPFVMNGDHVHLKSDPARVKAHGWWENPYNCPAKQAVVTVFLQANVAGFWITLDRVSRRLGPKPFETHRATAQHHCSDNAETTWRTLINVNLVGYKDDPRRAVTMPKELNCYW